MKIIDGDKLLKEIKEMDLEYMQQVDIIDCLEDLINKQPGISKEININKVTNFDNRKANNSLKGGKYMSEDNCLNCIFFDKNNRWCDISDPKEYQEDYELEATWCNCYERTNS